MALAARAAGSSVSSDTRLVASARDEILDAIDTLPAGSGTALTRGDLQNQLNDAYRESRAIKK